MAAVFYAQWHWVILLLVRRHRRINWLIKSAGKMLTTGQISVTELSLVKAAINKKLYVIASEVRNDSCYFIKLLLSARHNSLDLHIDFLVCSQT